MVISSGVGNGRSKLTAGAGEEEDVQVQDRHHLPHLGAEGAALCMDDGWNEEQGGGCVCVLYVCHP